MTNKLDQLDSLFDKVFDNFFVDKKENKKSYNIHNFSSFCNLVFNKNKGFYDIQDFQKNIVDWTLSNEGTRLIIATRGIGKSDIITCLSSLYRVYYNPNISILIITNQFKKSKLLLQFIHSIINNSPEVFSDLIVDDDILKESIRTKSNINSRKEPSIYISSLGTSLRGHHPDLIIFDDVISQENSFYETKREQAIRLYNEAKSLTSNVLIIGNITHPADLYSVLRHKKDVKVYEIYNDDPRIPNFLKVDVDKLRAQGVTEYSIQANYFGNLLPDDTLPFYLLKTQSIDNFNIFDKIKASVFIDFALGGKDSNAITICFLHNFRIYCLGFSKNCTWSDFIKDIVIPLCSKLQIHSLSYEDNIVGIEPSKYFSLYNINSIPVHTSSNKKAKISRLYQFKNDIILLKIKNEYNEHFNNQVINYSPKDSNCLDDGVDCLVMNLIAMNYIYDK